MGNNFRGNDWRSVKGNSRDCQVFNLKKEEQINYGWFFVSVAVAMAIGVFAASFMGGGFEIALLSGYAGSDLLESLVKLKFKEKFESAVKLKV